MISLCGPFIPAVPGQFRIRYGILYYYVNMNYLKTTLEDHELVAFVLGNLVYSDFISTTIMKTYNVYKKCALKTFMMRNDLYKVINASLINISIVYFINNLKFIVKLFSQYLT